MNYRKKYMQSSIFLMLCFLITSCASTKVTVLNKERALLEIEKPILVIPPLSDDIELKDVCNVLGDAFTSEIPKLINGPVIYAKNIRSLDNSLGWNNLIKNGSVNLEECITIAKNVGCSSIFVCRILEYKKYPPFKMVVVLKWIDVETGDILAKAYNNVDILDPETANKFSTFSNHGPIRKVYEQFDYRTEREHSASLSPKQFDQYVAANSTQLLFGDLFDVEWYKLWNIL